MARSSTPSRRYTGSTCRSNTTSAAPPHTAIHSAWRTTAPASPARPAPCSCETDGVTAMTIPDMSSISGQYRLPPRAMPARSVALTRPAMMASATPMPICASCATMMGNGEHAERAELRQCGPAIHGMRRASSERRRILQARSARRMKYRRDWRGRRRIGLRTPLLVESPTCQEAGRAKRKPSPPGVQMAARRDSLAGKPQHACGTTESTNRALGLGVPSLQWNVSRSCRRRVRPLRHGRRVSF